MANKPSPKTIRSTVQRGRRVLRMAAVIAMFSIASSQVLAGAIAAKVIHVEDGDSITLLLSDNSQIKVRIHGIDAPETCHAQHDKQCKNKPGQPFGQVARDSLRKKVIGQTVQADCKAKDKYQRSVCSIYVGAVDVGLTLIQEGVAWHYAKYDSTPSYAKAHQDAKAAKRGLWAFPNPVNPSDWRKQCWEEKICPN